MNVQQQLQQIRNNPQMMQNPVVKNVFDMLDKKDSQGLRGLFGNTCNTMGVNPQDFLNKLNQR